MLDVLSRSHRGRVCEYRKGDTVVRTPMVLKSADTCPADGMGVILEDGKRFLSVAGSKIPLDSDILTSASSRKEVEAVCTDGVCVVRAPIPEELVVPEEAEIVVIPNAYEYRRDPRKLNEAIMTIREKAGYNRLVYLSGLAEPSTVALMAYMGVDLFDDTLVKASGIFGISMIPEGEINCGGDVSEDNVKALDEEIAKVSLFIKAERLRELVDQRAPSSPWTVATLRLFDDVGYEYQAESCSSVGCRFSCNTTQALRRADIKRYRDLIMERYQKPPHKRVLVLLPCSAKKPYHISKSHKAFSSAIHTAQHDTLVHEVIVTSPLGAVPRELDALYPANSYDIPVTGEWKCEEKKMIREMIGHIIAQGYDKIICHLGDDYELVEGLAEMECTVVGDSTSPASLQNLDDTLRRVTKGMETADYCDDRREAVKSLLRFQFGVEAADALMTETTFGIGKFPYWKIVHENPEKRSQKTQIGMLTPERGMVSLTMDGAQILADLGMYTVEMADFEMKGNLFAIGAMEADPNIHVGDEAVITLNGKVMGVGVAQMSGREMVDLKRGIAVKVRHKAK